MKRLPSASVSSAFSAETIASGVVAGTPRGMAAWRRAVSAWLAGPGIEVLREITGDMRGSGVTVVGPRLPEYREKRKGARDRGCPRPGAATRAADMAFP